MLIWRYLVPTNYGNAHAYGTPVDVFLPGVGRVQVVYQFQPEAVVHWQSGQILARIPDGPGWPQGKAQAAINALKVSPDKIARAVRLAHVINENPEVF